MSNHVKGMTSCRPPESETEKSNESEMDLINRRDAIDYIESEYRQWGDEYGVTDVLKDLEDMPSAQPEIIRCKDCKYYIKSESYCDYLGITISDLDFCSLAERRTDGSY